VTVSLNSQRYDVIVVGMGPAGASTAFELARRGISVLAFDKQVHPRYKVCGGGLSARIEKILPSDFSSVIEECVHRVQFTYGGNDSFLVELPQPIAYMVMRATFDQWLTNKAREAGSDIREQESVIGVKPIHEGVEVETKQGRYQSRFVIGADGAMSIVARQCFPGQRLRTIPALESEVSGETEHAFQRTPTALISLSAAQKGYGWVFPKQQGLSLGVGVFVRGTDGPKRSFQEFIQQESSVVGLQIPQPMGYPLPISHSSQWHHRRRWAGSLVQGRAALVGDAGHLVDPLLGEGIYYSVRSGQLAAQSIAAVMQDSGLGLETYEQTVAEEFGLEFQVAARLGRIIYGVPRSWHRWAGRTFPDPYQRVLRRYCELLQGRETYQSLWDRILRRLKGRWGINSRKLRLGPSVPLTNTPTPKESPCCLGNTHP